MNKWNILFLQLFSKQKKTVTFELRFIRKSKIKQ
jgi:hypothetical protein